MSGPGYGAEEEEEVSMASVNYGICNSCRKRVPAEHVIRDGQVYLRKNCPDCGPTEALVSSDAERWRRKRRICHYDQDAVRLHCTLRCESCNYDHHPRMVFLDVTNRCNMNCPICIANIPGMGFEFHPPLSYFQKVLKELGKRDPKPVIMLFGGEPTMREDLFEIMELCRINGLDPRLVTNGLKLADEEYCKRVCEYEPHVLLAFDGRDPEIYARLRKNPNVYARKLKALENLKKHSRRRMTLMCCVARHINDRHMADLIQFCHDNRHFIKCLHLIPLTETWEEGEFATDITTTTEDVEQIIDDAFPEGHVEFLPAGLSESLRRVGRFLHKPPARFGGVHPNCESGAYLVSDGQRYRPASLYLKRPLAEVAQEMDRLCAKIDGKLAKLDPDKPFQRLRGRLLIARTFARLFLGSVNFRAVMKGNRVLGVLRILFGLLLGRRLEDLVRRHTHVQGLMLMIVLPFEEYHSVESARLQNCFAGFAYEDPDTGEVKTIPVCMWGQYKNDIQRRLADKYRAESLSSPA